MADDYVEIKVIVRDYEDQLVKMIDYIMHAANPGHSFEVVVDPEMREHRKTFFFDGDGSFHIKSVKRNGKKVKVMDDKLIEGYLKRIQ